ncbi:glycosyltransferase family 2 protein [Candidatus Woesearchaeota archaeon]|jgi:polyprenyl-phospho-N-acetylgalactosaminyl synthase|nr:glycosyltransferase family 2 protein [Candidatus Woesearchaeota archaeon]MBT4387364.1 glycosyltransferase family 2 protein [Candidatus Woesearchaeota archaeon]MBT4595503.1 glycosyltransferase family 2 protein [Candidatus Woesearchaeota archaeon]MBT5741124.1 glycosyltransferase family 2 protein [Candidatus Woesearchaeota archaeon]MBT7849568.1 glycosyltransferase family 2 protein [Candidatus Woesearchaeota archaeon]
MNKNSIYFVIPAYNEEKIIGSVLKKLNKNGYFKIIVINDNSSDNTHKISKKYAYVINHKKNRGQGAALRHGINYCLKQSKCKYIVTFDADGQHRIEDLNNMLKPVIDKKCEITLGSRFLCKKSNMPFIKWFLLKLSLVFTLLISHINLTDTHNGYRVMNRYAAKCIEIKENCMAHASEIIDEIGIKKIKYKEIPVIINYNPYVIKKHNFYALIKRSIFVAFKMIIRKFRLLFNNN